MNSVEFDNTEPLAELFKLGPLRYLTVAEIGRDKRMQFAQTYLMMARLGYRPAGAEWRDRSVRASGPAVSGGDRLRAGIRSPGKRQSFPVVLFEHGSGPAASRAFVLLIEAARLLTVADDLMAARLLRLALRQIGLEDDDT